MFAFVTSLILVIIRGLACLEILYFFLNSMIEDINKVIGSLLNSRVFFCRERKKATWVVAFFFLKEVILLYYKKINVVIDSVFLLSLVTHLTHDRLAP